MTEELITRGGSVTGLDSILPGQSEGHFALHSKLLISSLWFV